VLLPFLGLIVFMGVYPKPVLDRIEPSVDALITHVEANTDFVARADIRSASTPTTSRRTATMPTEHHDEGEEGRVMLQQVDTFVGPEVSGSHSRRCSRCSAARSCCCSSVR
jgi:hypothetical protein